MASILELLEEGHKDLHQWFTFHLECLLVQQDELADQAWQTFTGYLQKHLNFESTEFLQNAWLADLELQWPVIVYQKEHEKLEQLLKKQGIRLESYYQLAGRKKRLALLEVVDKALTLQHVMEHHEQREEQDLLIQLEGLDKEKKETIQQQWLQLNSALEQENIVLKQQLNEMLNES